MVTEATEGPESPKFPGLLQSGPLVPDPGDSVWSNSAPVTVEAYPVMEERMPVGFAQGLPAEGTTLAVVPKKGPTKFPVVLVATPLRVNASSTPQCCCVKAPTPMRA